MKILIVEDEKMAAQTLKGLLLDIAPEVEIEPVISNVKEAVRYLLSEPGADLIFLDIHLADGSAFEIFEKVLPNVPVVFVTAYDSYAVKAFEINSLDYLLKPISSDRLLQTINRFRQQMIMPTGSTKEITNILKKLQGTENFKSRFLVKGGSRLLPVEVQQIAYFYRSKEGNVFLITSEGKRHIINYNLETLENILDPKMFFRLNRQIIAKFSALADIQNYFNGKLKITLDPPAPFEVLVSQERSRSFKEWLEK